MSDGTNVNEPHLRPLVVEKLPGVSKRRIATKMMKRPIVSSPRMSDSPCSRQLTLRNVDGKPHEDYCQVPPSANEAEVTVLQPTAPPPNPELGCI